MPWPVAPPIDAGAELIAAVHRLPVMLLGWILAQLSLFVGFTLLLLLPGVFLLVCYLVLLPVLLFEKLNPYTALVRSVQLVRPHWWKALATLVIAVLVLLICTLAVAREHAVRRCWSARTRRCRRSWPRCTVGIWAIGCVFF